MGSDLMLCFVLCILRLAIRKERTFPGGALPEEAMLPSAGDSNLAVNCLQDYLTYLAIRLFRLVVSPSERYRNIPGDLPVIVDVGLLPIFMKFQ